MADPVIVTCASACTVTQVISIDAPIFNLTIEQGAQIAGAILAVWAVAWVFRVIAQTIGGNSSTSERESL